MEYTIAHIPARFTNRFLWYETFMIYINTHKGMIIFPHANNIKNNEYKFE